MSPITFVSKLHNFRNAVVLGTTILASSLAFSPKEAQAQTMNNDTIWGTGLFDIAEVENFNPIAGANIACTPIYIPGDTVTDNFTMNFITNSGGQTEFALPAMIDIHVGVNEKELLEQAVVAPIPSSDFTFAFHGQPLSNLRIHAMNGQLVEEVKPNYDQSRDISGAYINIGSHAAGTYTYSVMTSNGLVSGKIINNKGRQVGNLGTSILKEKKESLKSVQTYEALYDVIVTAEGYETYTTEQTIIDGNNGLITYFLTPGAGLTQTQDLGGIVYDESGSPLEGVTARVVEQGTNIVLGEMVTSSDGEYVVEDVPAGTDVYFQIGGLTDKFAFDGDEYEVPDVIEQEADTAKLVFMYTLYNKSRQVPNTSTYITPLANHIKLMTSDGQIEGALRDIKYYLGPSMSEAQKAGTRANYTQLMNDVGLPGMYEESPTELNQDLTGYNPYTNPKPVGINIEQGANQTNRDFVNIITPLGNELTPSFSAEMTLDAIDYLSHAHENGRAFNLNQVSWPSIMDGQASTFTNEDKVIWNMSATHDKKIYDEAKAYFTLYNITNSISTKAPENGGGYELNYELVPNKPKPLPSADKE